MYFDSHCHIDHLINQDQVSDYISSFSDEKGSGFVFIGTNLNDSQYNFQIYQNTRDVCQKNGVKLGYTIGVHPGSVADIDDQVIANLEILINQGLKHRGKLEGLVGMGEIGTDLHYNTDNKIYDKQKYFFNEQCKLAIKYNLPVVIHSRDDFDGTIEVIRNYPNLKVYFHCRGYSIEELIVLKSIFGNNLRIGFCGNISYPKANILRESFKYAWEDNIKILIETDAPYLSIQSLRGQPNHSKNIHLHYEYISSFLGIDEDNLINKVKANYVGLYG